MKQQILAEINSKLSALGIPVQNGNGADIIITTEFLDAGWSTGSKKINYDATIFLDEQIQTAFMYEKTTEKGHGLSFGGDSGSSFQSGTTLFRKVKSVQYGLDGKAYEYTLDLGAIPKTVKETVKAYGWKFKTVINKSKAMYPAGYTPQFASPIQPEQNMQSQKTNELHNVLYSQSNASIKKPKYNTLSLICYIIYGLIALAIFALMDVSIVGWILGIIAFGATGFMLRKLNSKGCFTSIVILIISLIIIFGIMVFTSNTDSEGTYKESNSTVFELHQNSV